MPAEWDGLWWRLGPLGYVEDARDATARPPKTRDWAGTAAVIAALHAALDDPDPLVRRAAVENATLALDQGTVEPAPAAVRRSRGGRRPAGDPHRPRVGPRPQGDRAGPRRPPSSLRERRPPPARHCRRPSARGAVREGRTGEAGGGRDPAAAADRRAAGHRRTGGGRCGPRRTGPPQPPRTRKSVPPRWAPWPGSAGTRPKKP